MFYCSLHLSCLFTATKLKGEELVKESEGKRTLTGTEEINIKGDICARRQDAQIVVCRNPPQDTLRTIKEENVAEAKFK